MALVSSTHLVLPHRRPCGHEATRGVPLNVSDTVVISGVHQLKVSGKVLVRLGLLALKVQVEEVEVRALCVADSRDDNEATPGSPVDSVVVLLVEGAEMLKAARDRSLGLLGAEESDGGLGRHSGNANGLGGSDDGETVALGLPCKVDDCILDGVDNLDWNALLLDAEDFESRCLRLLGF